MEYIEKQKVIQRIYGDKEISASDEQEIDAMIKYWNIRFEKEIKLRFHAQLG